VKKFTNKTLVGVLALGVYTLVSQLAALTADRSTEHKGEEFIIQLPVKASTKIYKGSLVTIDATGYALPSADTAATFVAGIALEQVDNSSGASGAKFIRVAANVMALLNVTGAFNQADVGKTCFVSDDNTVSVVATTNNIKVGRVLIRVSATSAWVYIPATNP